MKGRRELAGLPDTLMDPTRGSIFNSLLLIHPEGITASQLAEELDFNVNTIYYHLRQLLEAGLLSEPEVVVKSNYIEKYYRVAPEVRSAFERDPTVLDEALEGLSLQQRKKVTIALCSIAALLFTRAARQIDKMTAEEFEELWDAPALGIISIGRLDTDSYKGFTRELQKSIAARAEMFENKEKTEAPHGVVIGALPFIGSTQ